MHPRTTKTSILLLTTILSGAVVSGFSAQGKNSGTNKEKTLAESLCASYENISSISCEIRKTSVCAGETVRMLSRVYYKTNGYIHVDCMIPTRVRTRQKRILSDGKKLYYYEQGHPKGFCRPVDKLEEPILSTYKSVPSTPVEMLMGLKGAPETKLDATEECPIRMGYQTDKVYVVLSCDKEKRPVEIDFYNSSKMKALRAEYHYSDFEKVNDDCWIPLEHKATVYFTEDAGSTHADADGKVKLKETRRISNLEVNRPIPQHLFDPTLFFKDVKFTDDFEKTLPSP